MHKTLMLLLALLFATIVATPANAQIPNFRDLAAQDEEPSFGDSRDVVSVELVPLRTTVPRGGDLPVAVVFQMDPGWHIWLPKAIEDQLPADVARFEYAVYTAVTVTTDGGNAITMHPEFIQWPEHHLANADLGDGPADYPVYEARSIAYLPITVPADATLGTLTVNATVTVQSCDETQCAAPADIEVSTTIEIVELGAAEGTTADGDLFAGFDGDVFGRIRGGERAAEIVSFDVLGLKFNIDASGTVGLVLLLIVAAFGGFLLNLTPCVLPVIPLKIMGLSASAAGHRVRTLLLGLALAAGVIGFWLGLGILIATAAGFTSSNQLFQYPAFTIGVGVFIAVMAVGMCGLFTIRLPQSIARVNPGHDSIHGSVLFGVMTAILSTPCTAPFMGAAAGWAAIQTPLVTLSVFAAIGVGMALPYVILAAFPNLVKRLPRTGPASELLKQVMGLLMLAAAMYFIGVGLSGMLQEPPKPPTKMYWWAVALPIAAAGIWLAWRTMAITGSFPRRLIYGTLGVLLLAVAIWGGARFTDKGPIEWVYYTPERFAEAKDSGQVVVMEFTAEWCVNCKALEESVLRREDVAAALNSDDVMPIKVDLTKGDPTTREALNNAGRVMIPLLVVYAPDGTEVFKSDAYKPRQVLEAIASARAKTVAPGD